MVADIDLKNHIVEKIAPIMSSWTDDDTYAISFFVENLNGNPYMPTISIGHNTEEQYRESIVDAFDEREARWNFAFWLQSQEFVFGEEGETKNMVKQWIVAHGFPYCEDYSYSYESEAACNAHYDLMDTIANNFLIPVLVEAAKELRKSQIIQDKFGKEIPIIIHKLEYYNEIANQNIEANTLPLVKDFVDWVHHEQKV